MLGSLPGDGVAFEELLRAEMKWWCILCHARVTEMTCLSFFSVSGDDCGNDAESTAGCDARKVKRTVVPWPSSLSTVTLPPCSSTTRLTNASPRPTPRPLP